MPVSKDVLDEIALSQAEYDLIVDKLDREPNPVELGMFGALWSEHCGYKHSRPLLGKFPSRSARTLSRSGAENAGAIDIGNGLAVVFKVESHNHPSAVEPLQGAATGVGGIVRDILAMGARPIALLNSLRFGPLSQAQNRHLFNGVVEGISWYGNCIGVPDVGGEIYFDQSYSQNPLVNAMCIGLVEIDKIATAAASEVGNALLLVGADTGRDGIHGASGLASRTFEEEQELRPTVQVGNPFLEKILIEACLEALATGCVTALQDLGAAGLTSAAIESASSGGRGLFLDISQVPRREQGMTGYDVMLSESQERMLLAVPPEKIATVKAVFDKWEITCQEIGKITQAQDAHIFDGPDRIAQLPIKSLSEAPQYRLKGRQSAEQKQRQQLSISDVPLPTESANEILLKLLASPNIASKQGVYRQYDHQVQTNTVVGPGSDAAVLRIKGTSKAVAVTIDGNGRYCYLDPYRGGQIVVAEACRNLSCSGAEPLALTDCLNFGNPEKPDVYYQLERCIQGMAKACRVLRVPVVSGNVSLYNESLGQAIYPTPVIGGLGLLGDVTLHIRASFPEAGLQVVLLGVGDLRPKVADMAGSECLQVMYGKVRGRPAINLALEKRVQELCRSAIQQGVILSAHDCSDGGLAVALAECCVGGLPSPRPDGRPSPSGRGAGGEGIGFTGGDAFARLPRRWDMSLFGERQSRIVISVRPETLPHLRKMAADADVPVLNLGITGGLVVQLGPLDLPLWQLNAAWGNGLERALGG